MEPRKYLANAAGAPPSAPGAPSEGYPQSAVPGSTAATVPGPYWYYGIGEEIRQLIQGGGLTPNHAAVNQMAAVAEKLFGRTNAGDPNGSVAADRLYERCWDTTQTPPELYTATAADGSVGGTVWASLASTIPTKEVGEVFALSDDLVGVSEPSNAGSAKYIKLTAGEDGAGEYNEALLTGESVSGSAPLVVATAVIDHADSPMNGQTVNLINTERRFLRAGNSGALQDGQVESHSHSGAPGSFIGNQGAGGSAASGASTQTGLTGGDETRPRNIGTTYYMRIA